MDKKLILFGAGNFGRMALKHYGKERVAFFADNNEKKTGGELEGVPVISFEKMTVLSGAFQIIISSSFLNEMAEQLEQAGIHNYLYYSPVYTRNIEALCKEVRGRQGGRLSFFGVDESTEQIVRNIVKLCPCSYQIGDMEDSGYLGKVVAGAEVKRLGDLCLEDSLVILSSAVYHAAAAVYLRQNAGTELEFIDPFRQQGYYDTDEIVINPYEGQAGELTEEQWNAQAAQSRTIDAINRYVRQCMKKAPLFEFIEIETINRCNGVCEFCPVNKKDDPREERRMDRALFEKIVAELEEMEYAGELSLFSNNEPLLDERIVEWSESIRKRLPKARIHMFTNGTLFTLDKFRQLIPNLDELIIDNYRQDLKLIRPCREIREYVEQHRELRRKVTIVLRKPKEVLTSRGGDAPNRKELRSYPEAGCALPFQQMIVRPDGKVSLCCNDPLGRNTLGDLSRETIREVWFGEKFREVREALASGRENWDHCRLCDTFYLY